jgi:hypothetical protein
MRWRFPDPTDRREERERQTVLARVDAWWAEFRTKTADLDALFHGKKKWDLPEWMHRHLGSVSERLMWEFGPADGGHRLVITPEGAKYLRPLADVVLAGAPRLMGWTFLPARPPEGVEMMEQTVEAKTGEPLGATEVVASRGEANGVDLAFVLARPGDEEGNAARCFYAAESLVGEELLDKWVGAIEPVARAPKGHRVPPERLHETVEAVVAATRDQMPAEPMWQRVIADEVTSFQLEPERADEYPGRADLIVASSRLPEPWLHFHHGRIFYSERFSRCGEIFCYLKLDASGWPSKERVERRARIEDPLDEALTAAGVGTVIGGGSGIMYSYIDLLLGDVERALPVIRSVGRRLKAPLRSWLLFWDSEWRDEWLPVWDEAPPPPMVADDE